MCAFIPTSLMNYLFFIKVMITSQILDLPRDLRRNIYLGLYDMLLFAKINKLNFSYKIGIRHNGSIMRREQSRHEK